MLRGADALVSDNWRESTKPTSEVFDDETGASHFNLRPGAPKHVSPGRAVVPGSRVKRRDEAWLLQGLACLAASVATDGPFLHVRDDGGYRDWTAHATMKHMRGRCCTLA